MTNCREALHVIDSLIPIYGFPSYRTIGVVNSNIPPWSDYSLSSCQILIIYYHIVLVKEIPNYTRYLYDEVVKGNLNARDYATIMEFDRRSQKGYTSDSSLYYVRWEPVPDRNATYANEEEVNKRRESIGLSTCYYERIRKIVEWKRGFDLFPDRKATYSNEEEVNKRREAIGLSTCYYERVRKIWEWKYGFDLYVFEF